MTHLITHFFQGGTQEQYDAIVARAHPADGSLPEGQLHHSRDQPTAASSTFADLDVVVERSYGP